MLLEYDSSSPSQQSYCVCVESWKLLPSSLRETQHLIFPIKFWTQHTSFVLWIACVTCEIAVGLWRLVYVECFSFSWSVKYVSTKHVETLL